jgi:hypothetical protein
MPRVLVLWAWVLLIAGVLLCPFKITRSIGGGLLLVFIAYLVLIFVLSSECRRRLRSNGILGWLLDWADPDGQ